MFAAIQRIGIPSTRASSAQPALPNVQPCPQKPSRRIVDFDIDDRDEEWEDENNQLQGLGTTTHRSQNPRAVVIPLRKNQRCVRAQGENARATALKRRGATQLKIHALATDLEALECEREERAEVLATKHGVKVKEVRRRMLSRPASRPSAKSACTMQRSR